MNVFLIDTSVAVPLRDRDLEVEERFRTVQNKTVVMSIITRVALEGGVYRQPEHSLLRRYRLDLLLTTFPVLNFGPQEAECYGRILSAVRYSRRKLIDRMIAAQALVAGATLVTLNGDDVRDVSGLQLLEL